MPRGRSTRNEAIAADRRRKVAALYLQGRTIYEIGPELGVSVSTVSRDPEAVRNEWLAPAAADFNQRKAEELQRLDLLESEAWGAWERSKGPAVTETVTERA